MVRRLIRHSVLELAVLERLIDCKLRFSGVLLSCAKIGFQLGQVTTSWHQVETPLKVESLRLL